MNRRQWLLGGAGVAAAAAGSGWYAWRGRADDAAESLWSLRFATPAGPDLAMASLRGRPLLLNFWATWCVPCIQEMPDLDRFARSYAGRGWQVLGLAVDSPGPVLQFLQRVPVSFPVALAGLTGVDLSRRLGNNAGALPFSAVFDARGRLVERRLGASTWAELARWGEAAL